MDREMQKMQRAAGGTVLRENRVVGSQKGRRRNEKVTQTRALAHTRKDTHTQSTLAALNVACRRKF